MVLNIEARIERLLDQLTSPFISETEAAEIQRRIEFLEARMKQQE